MTIFIWFWVAALLSPNSAWAEEGCSNDSPLIERNWEISTPSCQANSLEGVGEGTWFLPITPDRPDVITHARVQVKFVKPNEQANWVALVHFDFQDPKPYGIPFTFQRLKILWGAAGGAPQPQHSAQIDWSEQCQYAGRSMFPGQSWDVSLELPDTRELCSIPSPVLRLWGARF